MNELDTPTLSAFPRTVTPSPSIGGRDNSIGLGLGMSNLSLGMSSAAPAMFGSTPKKPPMAELAPPAARARKPFHYMRLLHASINEGSYLTAKLFIPKQVWTQTGIKSLAALDTKVRMLELLVNGLESLEKAGDVLLRPTSTMNLPVVQLAERFMKEFDSFEGLMDEIQNTLSKKLGYIDTVKGRKGGQSSFGQWSGKLSRSLDRMTTNKKEATEGPKAYVEALSRLFLQVQFLDRHVVVLHSSLADANGAAAASPRLRPNLPPYFYLAGEVRINIDNRLKRASEFFGSVVLRMAMRDVGVMLDKWLKRAGNWCSEA